MADLKLLESFPPKRKVTDKTWDEYAKEFVKKIGGITNSTWTKPIDKQNALDALNPATHTIPYLFALNAHINSIGKDNKDKALEYINHAAIFFASFDPVQVRYVDQPWSQLVDSAFTLFSLCNIKDLTPLSTALLRLDPTGGTFTTNHLRLLRQCLANGNPSQALPILDKDIYAFPQKPAKGLPDDLLNEESDLSNSFITAESGFAGKIKTEHVLEYYLLGAHVYIGLRRFSRARLFLEYVLLSPSPGHGTSALQMEAYKKWILLGLLSTGRRFPLPRTNDQQILKSIRATSKPYEALAEDFEKRDYLKFQAEAHTGTEIWTDDGNVRFVHEVSQALARYRVIDLQKTYAALSTLSDMIRAGQLNASLSPSAAGDAVLRFHPGATNTFTQCDESLEAQTKRIESLVASIKDADRRLRLSNEYVAYERRQKRSGAMEGDLAEQMDLTWDAPIARMVDDEDGDEDIMAS